MTTPTLPPTGEIWALRATYWALGAACWCAELLRAESARRWLSTEQWSVGSELICMRFLAMEVAALETAQALREFAVAWGAFDDAWFETAEADQ